MTREEKIADFLELREEVLTDKGEWLIPHGTTHSFSSLFGWLAALMGGAIFVTLVMNFSKEDMGAVFVALVGFCACLFPFLAMILDNLSSDIKLKEKEEVSTSSIRLCKDGLLEKMMSGTTKLVKFSDIKFIKIRRVGIFRWSPKFWFVYYGDGEMMTIRPEYVLEQSEFVVFMRSTFPDLVVDEAEERMGKNSLVYQAINLYGWVLKSDGNGTEKSRDFVVRAILKNFFNSSERNRWRVTDCLNKTLERKQQPFRTYCNQIISMKRWNYGARYDFLDRLFECAYISDGINEAELEMLREIGRFLLLREWHIASLEHTYELGKREQNVETGNFLQSYEACMAEARRELGVAENASLAEVKRVYEYMIKKWDPALLPADTPQADREMAKVRFRTIKETCIFLCANMKS